MRLWNMRRFTPALAALALSAAGPARAEDAATAPVSVTNTQVQRVAYCTLIVDGRARANLAIRPGKTWSDTFDPRREVLLVCDRATSLRFGPLKAGVEYRLVEVEGRKVALADGSGA